MLKDKKSTKIKVSSMDIINFEVMSHDSITVYIDEFRFSHNLDERFFEVELLVGDGYEHLDTIYIHKGKFNKKRLEEAALGWMFTNIEEVQQ